MLSQKIFKIRIFNLAENELLTTKFPDFLGKFPDLQGSLSNSLTFPGQWQPCKAVTFQQFFSWFCFVPLWFSLSFGFASWEGSLVLAFMAKTRLIKCGWYAFRFKWNSDVSIGAGKKLGHWPCPNNEIFVKKKTSKIFSLRINAKCLKNNLNN